MIESDAMSKKFKELDINGSLPISVLLGMIKLKGLNNFLKKNTKRQSNVYIRCKYRTAVNEFTTDSLKTIHFQENDGSNGELQLTSSLKSNTVLTPLLISLNISKKQSV